MSFSAHRKAAEDPDRALQERASHARSCAVLVAEKYRLRRSQVIERVHDTTGVSLHDPGDGERLSQALDALQRLKDEGLGPSG